MSRINMNCFRFRLVLPIVVVWAVFVLICGDGKQCVCDDGELHCKYATETCYDRRSIVTNGSAAKGAICGLLNLEEPSICVSEMLDLADITYPEHFYQFNDYGQPIYYQHLSFSVLLTVQVILMLLQKVLLRNAPSQLALTLSRKLNRPISCLQKREIFFSSARYFNKAGYIIWIKELTAFFFVILELVCMAKYTNEGVLNCFINSFETFFRDRLMRNDGFYQAFPQIVDCRLRDVADMSSSVGNPAENDQTGFDTLCFIPLNHSFEAGYRLLYCWTVLVVFYFAYRALTKFSILVSCAARELAFRLEFTSQFIKATLFYYGLPNNVSAAAFWFFQDLKRVISIGDFDNLIYRYLERAVYLERISQDKFYQ